MRTDDVTPQVAKVLSDQGIEKEGDLRFLEDASLDLLLTFHRIPLTQKDKTKIREVRQWLLVEEEERTRSVEEERLRLEEEVTVTREEAELMERQAELMKRKAEEAARKKAKGDAARQKAAEEWAACKREEEARKKDVEEELARREEEAGLRREAEERERLRRQKEQRIRREAEELKQLQLEKAFPTLSKLEFSKPFKEVGHHCKELSHPISSFQRNLL